MNKQLTVGMVICSDYQALVSLSELEIHSKRSKITMLQYCNLKMVNDFIVFRYSPFTGEEIDWIAIREYYLEKEESENLQE